MFFKSQLKDNLKELITVDISQEIVDVGKKHFGFKEDEVVKSVIKDAYQYVEEES
jgi:spermidine synthase